MLCFRTVRLADASQGDVVRNQKNGSYYRYERPDSNRTRIRPLELFPNGLLIPKSADTIVEPHLEVEYVGRWSEAFFVDTEVSEKGKRQFTEELTAKRDQLTQLEAEMATVDPNAHGGRGSHVNKIKAVARRVESLERGLAARPKDVEVQKRAATKLDDVIFQPKSFAQLPSGLPAMVIANEANLVKIGCKGKDGEVIRCTVPPQTLRPLEHRHLATV